jgi:hypothetical protein
MAVALAGCAPAKWFPEFFYSGTDVLVNLVADKTLAADWQPDPTLRALGNPASMYLAWEAAADASVAAPALPASVVADSSVYRLEVKSVITGGDFTALTPGPVTPLGAAAAGWRFHPAASVGGAGTHEIVAPAAPNAINGNTLHFQTPDGLSRLDFPLRDPVSGAVDGFAENASYLVRFSYRSDDKPVIFEFRDDRGPIYTWYFHSGAGNSGNGPGDLTNLSEFPPTSILDTYYEIRPTGGADYFLTFGSRDPTRSDVQNAYVDNFRMVRTDVFPRVELRLTDQLALPVQGSGGTLAYSLESGKYRFSVWVHDDPTAGVAAGRYASRAVVLTITGGDLGGSTSSVAGTSTTTAVITRDPTTGWPGADATSGWALLSVETGSIQVAAPADPLSPVMVLTIAPTDWSSDAGKRYDAGSLLVAAPSLEFLSAVPGS